MRVHAVVPVVLAGCLGPWDPAWDTDSPATSTDDPTTDTDLPTDTDTEPPTDTGTPPTGLRTEIVDAPITTDTVWDAGAVWILAARTTVYVEGSSVLTIEPGVTVMGEAESSIVVGRDARIEARGTADQPIVLTSAVAEGSRKPGDWGGLVLLGNAPVNKSLPRQIEGVVGDEPRAQYGGSDPASNCGALDYVRIEFAGFEVFEGNELNGLTLGGCGTNTYVRHLQVHRGLDDGIEIFGGSVDLKYVVLTGNGDDSLDWDEGWSGRVQFLVVQQYPVHPDPAVTKNGDEAFESDGYVLDEYPIGAPDGIFDTNVAPYSTPQIYNVTLLGSNDPASVQSAMELKEGTGGEIRNALVGWQTGRGVDVVHPPTADMTASGDLVLTNSMFFGIGPTGDAWVDADSQEDDGLFDELAWLETPASDNRFGLDGGLPLPDPPDAGNMPAWIAAPTTLWIPPAGSSAENFAAALPNDEFFDAAASYVGAIRPGTSATAAWWSTWTAFPVE